MLPPVSVVISTYNREKKLKNLLDSLFRMDYSGKSEVIVVNDGSTDGTSSLLKSYSKKVRVITHEKNMGTGAGKNTGFRSARYNLVTLIDDDCIVDKNWLKDLTEFFLERQKEGKKVGAVTSVNIYSGHSICYLRDAVLKAGGFSKEFSSAFREDTDLAFRMQDLGYELFQLGGKAKFIHDPPVPKTMKQKVRYVIRRVKVHEFDALLLKKHPVRAKEFFNMRYGFTPFIDDFKRATGLWYKGGKFELGSPQGLTLVKGSLLTYPIIFLGGLIYATAVKFIHLKGSSRCGVFIL